MKTVRRTTVTSHEGFVDLTEKRQEEDGRVYGLYPAWVGDLSKESMQEITECADIFFADLWKKVDEILERKAYSEFKNFTFKASML